MALTGTCWSECLPGGLCAFYLGVGWGAEAPSLLTLCSAAVASLGPWYQDDASADGSFVLLGVAGERRGPAPAPWASGCLSPSRCIPDGCCWSRPVTSPRGKPRGAASTCCLRSGACLLAEALFVEGAISSPGLCLWGYRASGCSLPHGYFR